MLVIPKQQPLFEGLSSYFLNIRRFFEHFQSEPGSFGIHMKSPLIEGIVYLDSGSIVNALCQSNSAAATGDGAVSKLMAIAEKQDVKVSVYQVDPNLIFIWANSLNARPLHKNLTSDITDLDRLIAKMTNERLTGMIEVSLHDGSDSGLVFFHEGKILHASTLSGQHGESTEDVIARLIQTSRSQGGTFQVNTIPAHRGDLPHPSSDEGHSAGGPELERQTGRGVAFDPVPMLEELLGLAESLCSETKQPEDFQSLFRKAALKLADKYRFLDPFEKDFDYSKGKIRLETDVQSNLLVAGVLACVQLMFSSLGLAGRLKEKAEGWFRSHDEDLKRLGIKVKIKVK
jgi:hypothetical protein